MLKNWKIERAKSLCRKGKFSQSRAIVERLLSRFPDSAALSTFRADLYLFEKNYKAAKLAYEEAKLTLAANSLINSENRQYINAYIGFRKKLSRVLRQAKNSWSTRR